jgi:hypothetical protein
MRVLNGFFGWKVVWVAFLVAVFAWGVGFYGPSVFLLTLHATHGWSIFTISAAITVHFFFSAVIVTYLPEIHRRLGIDRGSARSSVASSSQGSGKEKLPRLLRICPCDDAMVSRWFDRDRPKALRIAFNGVRSSSAPRYAASARAAARALEVAALPSQSYETAPPHWITSWCH